MGPQLQSLQQLIINQHSTFLAPSPILNAMSLKNRKYPSYFTPIPTNSVTAAFPASEAFDIINSALTSSDKERKDAIKQGNAVFAFTLKNKAGETESWHIDLKNKGEAGKGLGEKPTGM